MIKLSQNKIISNEVRIVTYEERIIILLVTLVISFFYFFTKITWFYLKSYLIKLIIKNKNKRQNYS